jgi:hypothetical protein
VLARLCRLADRYFITLVFTVLGWANAESWPYLLAFVAFGAVLDIYLVKPRPIIPQEMLSSEEKSAARARWIWLLPVVIGCHIAALIILIVTAGLMRESPETIEDIGPILYQWGSPFSALLRNHHTDLTSHGLPDRANLVALVYSQLFLLFYGALGIWLVQVRNIGALDHPRSQHEKPRRHKLLWIAMIALILPAVLLFALYHATWVDIDYGDHKLRRRHINTNLADYNVFFFNLAFLLGALGMFIPVLHLAIRMTPFIFSKRASKQAQPG